MGHFGRWTLASVAAVAMASPAGAEWRDFETAHFRIITESSPAEVEKFAATLESYDKLMRMATGIKDDKPVKVRIYQVAGLNEVEKAINELNSGIAGFYDSNALGPYAVTPKKTSGTGRYFTPDLVLHHEYAHHFMLQYFPAIYPGWYTEGFAELIGSSKIMDDGRIGYGMPALHRGNDINAYWAPLQDLLTKEKVHMLDTYAQGWAVTHFLTFDSKRSAQLRQYLTALGKGKSLAEAATAFGDLDELNREARRYVTAGSFEYRPVNVDIARPLIERSRALSPGEAALIPETIAFRDGDLSEYRDSSDRNKEASFREHNLDRIRDETRRFPADPFALHLLGEVEYVQGNYAAAEAVIDRMLAAQPNDRAGMTLKSILLSRRSATLSGDSRKAMVGQARDMAVKANRSDPDDPRPLLAYYQSYNLSGETPPPVAVQGLMQAVSLLPRENAPRQLLVDELARERRFDEAIAWLMPVANSPHRSPRREKARQQMEQLKAAKAAAGKQVATTG
jgi:tetratricopeptide (TPR) repeat protein